MIQRIHKIVSSQANVKRVSRKILEGHCQPQKLIEWTRLICSWRRRWNNYTEYNEKHKSYVNEYLHGNTPRFLYGYSKYLLVSADLREKVKGNDIESQKPSALKIFSLARYSKKCTTQSNQISYPPLPPTPPFSFYLV